MQHSRCCTCSATSTPKLQHCLCSPGYIPSASPGVVWAVSARERVEARARRDGTLTRGRARTRQKTGGLADWQSEGVDSLLRRLCGVAALGEAGTEQGRRHEEQSLE